MDAQAADTFAKLAYELHGQEGFEETLGLLVAAAPALVGADSAGVLLMRRGRVSEAGPGTDSIATKCDGIQLECEEGPAWAAVLERHSVLCLDAAGDPRWPAWGPAVVEQGVHSALAVRMWTSHSTLGAITFYAMQPDWFDESAVAIAEIVGRHASIALASARQEESMVQAIDGRKLVGQAQGILMERFQLDDKRAFDVLRRYSQANNVKLIEVARLLVSTGQLPDT